jgi:predicted phosphodiesterase
MKCIKIDLPRTIETLKIEIFSDMHLGSKKCDYKLIQSRVKSVLENENTYCIILGDILNNSTTNSVGDTYEEELTPMEQIKQATVLFEPIKHKILGVVSGNHERRSYRSDGIDLLYFMCSELKIADKYNPVANLLFVRFGSISSNIKESNGSGKTRKVLYTIYMTHGSAGGKLIGGKANGLQRLGGIVNSDIIIVGHTHMPMTFRESTLDIDTRNSTVISREQVFVNASAALDYEEYAETFGFKPSSKKSPVIYLGGTKKEIDIKL